MLLCFVFVCCTVVGGRLRSLIPSLMTPCLVTSYHITPHHTITFHYTPLHTIIHTIPPLYTIIPLHFITHHCTPLYHYTTPLHFITHHYTHRPTIIHHCTITCNKLALLLVHDVSSGGADCFICNITSSYTRVLILVLYVWCVSSRLAVHQIDRSYEDSFSARIISAHTTRVIYGNIINISINNYYLGKLASLIGLYMVHCCVLVIIKYGCDMRAVRKKISPMLIHCSVLLHSWFLKLNLFSIPTVEWTIRNDKYDSHRWEQVFIA